jgi:WD40 repeat protein
VRHCLACHGPKKAEGEYQLHTFARLMKTGASEVAPIVAGKPEESYLVDLIASDEADVRMPKENKALAAEQIELVRRWIAEGAAFDGPDAAAPLESYIKAVHPDPPAVYPRPVPVTALAFSPDGGVLATGGYHEALLWSINGQSTAGQASSGTQARDTLNADTARQASSGTLAVRREPHPPSGSEPYPPSGSTSPVLIRRINNIAQRTHAIAFNADGTLMAVAAGTPGRLGEVKLFDTRSSELVAELGTMSDEMFDVEFSREGARLAACGADRTIRIYDVAERKELRRIEAHADWVMAIAWSGDGTRLASAGRDKAAKVIDPVTGTVIVTYPGHDEQVYDVLFSASGEHVFSAGRGRELHRWVAAGDDSTKKDVRSKVTGAIVGRTGGDIFKLALEGGHVLAATADGKLCAFDPEQKDRREPAMIYEGAPRQAFALALHEPTKRIAVGGYDGRVTVYEVGDSAPWHVLVAAPGYVKK